jgi:UDP-N-acetylmuramate dehydrogenase
MSFGGLRRSALPVPRERLGVPLAELTTLRLGGPARRFVEATAEDHVIETVAAADAAGEPVLMIAGGSNLVVADAGFDGTAVRVLIRGASARANGARASLTVAAGEPWDEVVRRAGADGLAGIECLSGIPGSTGATPIQNVGAYGQQVSDVIVAVRAYDRLGGRVLELPSRECGFAYRSSAFRHSDRFAVLNVTFELERSRLARPIRYPELARALGVQLGARPPLAAVREAVLVLRRRKGMLLDSTDPDSVSAGSFFVNPILSPACFAALERRVVDRLGEGARPPAWPEPGGPLKTSAAWLIEQAGFHRGFSDGRVGISTKHTLALVNRGGAGTTELIALARQIRGQVRESFGVTLEPEPTLIGVEL